jgi:diguanylate cyclase (GGDEF)-like protein/PAS domain S-box-containing protein
MHLFSGYATEVSLETDNKTLLRLLDEIGEGVYFTDTKRRITFWNKAAERISGFGKNEVLGHSCRENILIHVDHRGRSLCAGLCPLAHTLQDRKERRSKVFLHHKEGHRVPVQVRVFPLLDKKKQVIGAAEVFSDSSAKLDLRERLTELEKLAMGDRLTGVANRRYTEQFLQVRLVEFRRYHWPFGIIFFDIDDFKSLNDRFSHRIGDRALKTVAMTLQKNIRSVDQVGRWGGEEFIIVLRNPDKNNLKHIAEKLRLLVEKSIFWEKGIPIRFTLSGGATLVRTRDTKASLVERADLLMYQSKKAGKNRISCD